MRSELDFVRTRIKKTQCAQEILIIRYLDLSPSPKGLLLIKKKVRFFIMNLMKLKPSISTRDAIKLGQEIVWKLYQEEPFLKAYLFGSGVNGGLTADSDLDFLVIYASQESIRRAMKCVAQKGFAPIATDWIFKINADFQKRKEIGGVCFEAFHHGVELSP